MPCRKQPLKILAAPSSLRANNVESGFKWTPLHGSAARCEEWLCPAARYRSRFWLRLLPGLCKGELENKWNSPTRLRRPMWGMAPPCRKQFSHVRLRLRPGC